MYIDRAIYCVSRDLLSGGSLSQALERILPTQDAAGGRGQGIADSRGVSLWSGL